jgi:hypothetical protein
MTTMPFWVEPWPTIAKWIDPVMQYVAMTSPLYFITPRGSGGMSGALWGMGLQVIYGTAFIILAAIRLRPSFRNDGGTRSWIRGIKTIGRKQSWLPRRECGDDAMLWKEKYVARTGGLTKAALVVLGVGLVGVIGYSAYGFLAPAVEELWRDGYSVHGSARRDFNSFLRGVSTAIYVLWMLGIASSSASGLSSEREEDQWTSLISTPLEGHEILRAKMIGPVWGLMPVAYLMFLMWGVGLVVGSIHPFGVLACLVEFVVFTWFLTALGTFLSLRSKNSTRSLALTMAILIFLNGGYLFCCIPIEPNTMAIAAGATPFIFAMSLLSVQDYTEVWHQYRSGETFAACVMGVMFYGFAAAGLTSAMFGSFDSVVDRPDRLRHNRTPNQQREYLRGGPKKWHDPGELA